MKYLLAILVLILTYILFTTNNELQRATIESEMAIQRNKEMVAMLNDTISKKDSLIILYRIKRESLEKEVALLRTKYENLRPHKTSQSVDTLQIVIGVCDSTVVGQDSLIVFLNDELNMQFNLTELQQARGDTLQRSLDVLEEIIASNMKQLKKERRKRRLQVAGLAVLAVLLGLFK